MSRLTVTEKEHWMARLKKKIDTAINELCRDDPAFRDRIRNQATEKAYEELGIAELNNELTELNQQIEKLKERKKQVRIEIEVQVAGTPKDKVSLYPYDGLTHETSVVVDKTAKLIEEELLQESQLGRSIIELDREKDELLDTIWLSTSGKEVKDLWSNVATLLGQTPTDLQSKALAKKPSGKK